MKLFPVLTKVGQGPKKIGGKYYLDVLSCAGSSDMLMFPSVKTEDCSIRIFRSLLPN